MNSRRDYVYSGMRGQDAEGNHAVNERLIPVRQTWAAILALVLASMLSCALVVVRAYYAGTTDYLFFFWNLFLAWVPLGAALVFYGLAARQSRN